MDREIKFKTGLHLKGGDQFMNEYMKDSQTSEKQIDEIVVAQAGDDSAWDEPIVVQRDKSTTKALQTEFDIIKCKCKILNDRSFDKR